MALCVRYVDKKGMIKEQFLGIVHVGDTTSLSLKEAIFSLLDEHSLSFSRIRGQGRKDLLKGKQAEKIAKAFENGEIVTGKGFKPRAWFRFDLIGNDARNGDDARKADNLQELNNRFDEVSIELLTCMASLSLLDKFSSFDKQKILRLVELYPDEFTSVNRLALDDQLDNYIVDMRRDDRFWVLKDMGELSMKLVETKKHQVYQQVYLLIKLVLILPVATASVEEHFLK
ncbi:uncharacterized protein LOC120204474 [Hibiscus syriacus]|uniref:uncharacterized protein LOC120204474 n=1 Tax=Hibiscus syriacus TaxID=106335 RepID=UPI0019216087|nr:uncharacterized protein LOC120204474 [Hibiscus syriacus]